MTKRPYTKKELQELLESNVITDEFRMKIINALKDGSDAAINALGEKWAVSCLIYPEKRPTSQQV